MQIQFNFYLFNQKKPKQPMQMRLGWPYHPLDEDSCQSDQWRWSRCGAPEVIHGKVNGSAHKVYF